MNNIIISGEGGQGVRLISHTLATLLANLGYEVSLLYDYDSAVRGAMSVAYLTFDVQPIANPVPDKADLLLRLSPKGLGFQARRTVCESGLCTEEEIPFSKYGVEKFGKEIFGNMIAMGRLLRLIGIKVSRKELTRVLPLQYSEENVSAVQFGYSLKEGELGAGVLSRQRYDTDSEDLPSQVEPEPVPPQ
ncbi:MAG: korC [Dehalococcoidia bacterium]|nr:korC [Dehalococcoidia bacterium]